MTEVKLAHLEETAARREYLKRRPCLRQLFLELTLRCNERCLHCGKEIEGEGAFSLKEGGVLCFDCQGEGLMPFSEELRKTILALRDLDWQDNGSLKLQGGLIMQAEQITLSHLQNLLGHGLKAMEFINQI